MSKYVCSICGYVYDEAAGIPDRGIAPGTRFKDLPEDFTCPVCGAPKAVFTGQQEEAAVKEPEREEDDGEMREMSYGELSALCSNLAKGCEKQYLSEEAGLFLELAAYYDDRAGDDGKAGLDELSRMVEEDLQKGYARGNEAAIAAADRGAKRALLWGEKVTRMLSSLLERFEKEKEAMLSGTHVFVCEICGFIYIGDKAPEICPVCKVPGMKLTEITQVQRG
ncbi:rubredoxin [Anaerolentibacter hominis]|uniref:rubredoxin n=1 Tax=Anaerolentibacter hominis TaxID=3079009 RepID=UPI003CCEB75A